MSQYVKNNKYAKGNKGQRDMAFYLLKDVDEFKKKVDNYFKQLKKDKKGKWIINPTKSGLALYLGFESTKSLIDYREKQEFSAIIKKACLFIESYHENALSGNSVAGHIFWLKNAGWSDDHNFNVNNKNTEQTPEETQKEYERICEQMQRLGIKI